jgi:hypothetical protein
MLYPCEHFNVDIGECKPTCPHDLWLHGKGGYECDHWMNNCEEDDIFKPCREYTLEYRCDKTLDMFEEG